MNSEKKVKILMFHRVLLSESPLTKSAYFDRGTAISVSFFKKILEKIKSGHKKVLTFYEISESVLKGKDLSNAICLTFDDGYLDNFKIALPLLEEYNMKATFFPIIDFCFLRKMNYIDIYYSIIDSLELSELERKDYILGQKKKEFLNLNEIKTKDFINRLIDKYNLDNYNRNNNLYMSSVELKAIHDLGHEIGSHSLSHKILTFLDSKDIETELIESKKAIKGITKSKNITFCYPHGKYNHEIIKFVKKVGYFSACTVEISSNNMRWAIPRLFVKQDFDLERI